MITDTIRPSMTYGTQGSVRPMFRMIALGIVLVMVAIGLAGIGLGLAQDRDSAMIVAHFPEILKFHYVPSRSWGDPLYDILAAFLDALGGQLLVNLASVGFALLYARAMYRIIHPERSARLTLAFAAALLNPLVLSNSSALIETSLYLCLAMTTVAAGLSYLARTRQGVPYGFLAAMGLMVLTRPDSALFAMTIAACLLWDRRAQPATMRAIALGTVVTGAIVLAIYILLNHGLGFLSTGVMMGSSIGWRVGRAVISLVDIYGLIGSAVLSVLVAAAVVRRPRSVIALSSPMAFLDLLAIATFAVYLPRFVVLPDQLEYFIVPMTLSIVFLGRNLRSGPALVLIMLSMILSSAVHIALLQRHADGRIALAPSVNWGGVVQDMQARELNQVRATPEFMSYVAKAVYGNAVPMPSLHFEPWLDGFTSTDRDLIIGESSAYQIDDPELSAAPRYRSSTYAHVYICNEDLAPRQGWRVMQPAPSVGVLALFERGTPLACRIRGK
jgi:predicted membrane protein